MNTLLKKPKNQNYKICRYKAQNALQSGFQAQEANKNLKAAESILNELKNNITDENLKKSFEKITNEVFWTGALIEGTHYLQLVEKVVKGWEITNKLEKYITEKFYNIVHNAQQQYIQDELVKIENEKNELSIKALPQHGDSQYDPPMVLLDEKIYKTQHLFDNNYQTFAQRLSEEKTDFNEQLKQVKAEKDPAIRAKKAEELWNKVTTEIIKSVTIERKMGHSQNWKDHNFQAQGTNQTTIPYYNNEYNKYIRPNEKELGELRSYYSQRENFFESIKKQLEGELKNEMLYFGNMLSPVSSDFNMAAPFGSRFIGETIPPWVWRRHQGIDLANGKAGDPVRATLEGKAIVDKSWLSIIKEFTDENGVKYAWKASYLHMPPSSYQDLLGKDISIGDKIGTVSNYGTKQIHLHYENWFGVWDEDLAKKGDPYPYKWSSIDPTLGKLGKTKEF